MRVWILIVVFAFAFTLSASSSAHPLGDYRSGAVRMPLTLHAQAFTVRWRGATRADEAREALLAHGSHAIRIVATSPAHRLILAEVNVPAARSTLLASVAQEQRDFEAMIPHLEKRLAANPKWTIVRLRLGIAQVETQSYDAALKNIERALSELPPDHEFRDIALFYRSISLANLSKLEDAHRDAKASCEAGFEPACAIQKKIQSTLEQRALEDEAVKPE